MTGHLTGCAESSTRWLMRLGIQFCPVGFLIGKRVLSKVAQGLQWFRSLKEHYSRAVLWASLESILLRTKWRQHAHFSPDSFNAVTTASFALHMKLLNELIATSDLIEQTF